MMPPASTGSVYFCCFFFFLGLVRRVFGEPSGFAFTFAGDWPWPRTTGRPDGGDAVSRRNRWETVVQVALSLVSRSFIGWGLNGRGRRRRRRGHVDMETSGVIRIERLLLKKPHGHRFGDVIDLSFLFSFRLFFLCCCRQSVIFDEIGLTELSVAECSTKNANHSFQVRRRLDWTQKRPMGSQLTSFYDCSHWNVWKGRVFVLPPHHILTIVAGNAP